MSNTEENLNNFDETVEETINEKEDTSEVESNNKDDSNIKILTRMMLRKMIHSLKT